MLALPEIAEFSYLGDACLGCCEALGRIVRVPCGEICVDVGFRVGFVVVMRIGVRHGVFLGIDEKHEAMCA